MLCRINMGSIEIDEPEEHLPNSSGAHYGPWGKILSQSSSIVEYVPHGSAKPIQRRFPPIKRRSDPTKPAEFAMASFEQRNPTDGFVSGECAETFTRGCPTKTQKPNLVRANPRETL